MKTLVIYGAPRKLTNQHQLVHTPEGTEYFVRLQQAHSKHDAVKALENADPIRGETVLNTVEIP